MRSAPPTPADRARARAVGGTARTVSGIGFVLGLLGILNTSIDDLGADSAENLFVFSIHPLTAIAWLAIGLIGIAMATDTEWARRFLVTVGTLLTAWALLAMAIGDAPTQVLTRDAQVVALNLIGGLVSLAAALAPLPDGLTRLLDRPSKGEVSD